MTRGAAGHKDRDAYLQHFTIGELHHWFAAANLKRGPSQAVATLMTYLNFADLMIGDHFASSDC